MVETLGVLEGAGSTQGRHKPAVVVLRGHAGSCFWQQQSLCWGEGEGFSFRCFCTKGKTSPLRTCCRATSAPHGV